MRYMNWQKILIRNGFVLVLGLSLAYPLSAADEQTPQQGETKATQTESDEAKCVHGCERWGKFCNVDPRGVYKCRRRCEKFGKICE